VACGGFSDEASEGGLWVTNGVGDLRQLTKPCFEDPDLTPYSELWAWSPAGAQLVVARRSTDGDALVLIDPATGDRTDLGETTGLVVSLAWSPDGTHITYATTAGGGSIYSVAVDGGDHSLLASSVEEGFYESIAWSPDGAHILSQTRGELSWELYLMNADGSDLRPLSVDGKVWGISWSPDGAKLAYTTLSGGGEERRLQIWTQQPDGSAPSLLFESASGPFRTGSSPVWSPDGTRIAFVQPSEQARKLLRRTGETVWLVVNADGTGGAREIDGLRYLSWRGGWYSCECYG
jgi:TolB protein